MSDDQPTTPADDAELTVDAAAVTDGAYTLAVADFDDTEAAWAAYELLKSRSRSKASSWSSATTTASLKFRRRPITAPAEDSAGESSEALSSV